MSESHVAAPPPGRETRDNHFNLLRMLLAAGVLLGHCFTLTLGDRVFDGEPWFVFTLHKRILGTTCVLGFFIISGFLVSQSLERSASLVTYFRARLLRIYPAAIVCALLTGLVLGPPVSKESFFDYLQMPGVARFIVDAATFRRFDVTVALPAAFVGNPVPYVANGSIWTIPWELFCYVLLIPFGLLLYRSQHRWLRAASVLVLATLALAGSVEYALRSLPNGIARPIAFFGFFSIGVLGRAALSRWRPRALITALAFCALLIIARMETDAPVMVVALPFLFGIVLLNAATQLPARWLAYNKLGDFSYGLYLYAWPVQQTIVYVLPGITPWRLFALAFPVSLLLAVGSWRLVERPALRLKAEAIRRPAPDPTVAGARP